MSYINRPVGIRENEVVNGFALCDESVFDAKMQKITILREQQKQYLDRMLSLGVV